MTTVRAAQPDDRDEIVRLIDLAFHDLAANRWLVPQVHQRSTVMQPFFAIYLDHALAGNGTVHVAVDDAGGAIVGAALWYPSSAPDPAGYDDRLVAAVGPHRVDRFQQFEDLLHQHTPETTHDYLGFLAVAPDRQGRGVGGRLLRDYHHRLDARGRPAYLVASNRHSARLYARHGYQPLGGGRDELLLPDGAGVMVRMWRSAQTASDSDGNHNRAGVTAG